MEYTVFFDQANRINFQVEASSAQEAGEKAGKLYKKRASVPLSHTQKGWLVKSDGEDK